MSETETLYKWLGENRESCNGGDGRWPELGEWLEVEGELEPCEHGLHLCRESDLPLWIGPVLWVVEHDGGEIVECDDKVVVRRARLVERLEGWDERTARLFACDCAERAMARVDEPDGRSVEAVAVARRYAEGDASDEELAAARAAAWYPAAWSAAMDAARAAWYAASAAARDAAWDAERQWQAGRILEYARGEA